MSSSKPGRLVIVAAIAAIGATALIGGASASASTIPKNLAKQARWVNLHGRRVYGVPIVFQRDRHGRFIAHAAWGNASQLKNAGSGLCMSSYPNKAGARVNQYACNGSINQQWLYGEGTGGHYNIFAYGGNKLCLDNSQGRLANGNSQILWGCFDGADTPRGYAIGGSATAGAYMFHLAKGPGASSNYCLTSLGNRSAGSPIVEWVCNKYSANQAFRVTPGGWV
jgi:Ricin-type beta-trefoil lectin domain-like